LEAPSGDSGHKSTDHGRAVQPNQQERAAVSEPQATVMGEWRHVLSIEFSILCVEFCTELLTDSHHSAK